MIAAVSYPRKSTESHVKTVACTIAAAFVLFCVMLKWQPFHARLQLPILMMLPIPAAIWFQRAFSKQFTCFVFACLIAVAIFTAFTNPAKKISGRSSIFKEPRSTQMFYAHRAMQRPYEIAAQKAAEQGGVTLLIAAGDDWEYPLWVLMQEKSSTSPVIEAATPVIDLTSTRYGALICTNPKLTPAVPSSWHEEQCGEGVRVFTRAPTTPARS